VHSQRFTSATVLWGLLVTAGCSSAAEPVNDPLSAQPSRALSQPVRFEAPDQLLGVPRSTDEKWRGAVVTRARIIERFVSRPTDTLAEKYIAEDAATNLQADPNGAEVNAVAATVTDPDNTLKDLGTSLHRST
jgi:hypothetical protein